MHIKTITLSVISVLTIIALLTGCTKAANSENETTKTEQESSTAAQTQSDDDMFTKHDMDYTYDESSASLIELKDDASKCDNSTVTINKNIITITDEGTYILTGELTDGQIIINADKTKKIQLVLNNVQIDCSTSAPIYIKQADKVFITLAQDSKNTLTNKEEFAAIDDSNIDSVIFSKEDLTLNGNGTLNINTQFGHGIVSKQDLVLTSGTYNIEAKKHALQGKDSIRITNSTLNLISGKNALHSQNNDEDAKENDGFIYIKDGKLSINAEKKGIHAGKNVTINGATIKITKSNEGIEGESIDISGGEITIKSEDDGINAASSSDDTASQTQPDNPMAGNDNCEINISGGIININADGDGIDSNGNITITDGEIYIDGPSSDANSAIDYDGTAQINGGTIIALGTIGMAQNFSNESAQGTMLVNISGKSGSKITVKDSNSNTILTYTANKEYQCAVISCSEIKQGETYTITSDSQSTEITMESTVYNAAGTNDGAPGGNPGDRPNGSPRGGNMPDDKNLPQNAPQMSKPQ